MKKVAVIMGSKNDYDFMKDAITTLNEFGVETEVRIVSAHRTPRFMIEFSSEASGRGVEVIIAGAGGAAHLPGYFKHAVVFRRSEAVYQDSIEVEIV